jgi:hypothetical protein
MMGKPLFYWEDCWFDARTRGPFLITEDQVEKMYDLVGEPFRPQLNTLSHTPDGRCVPDMLPHWIGTGMVAQRRGYSALIAQRSEHYEFFLPLHFNEQFWVRLHGDLIRVIDERSGIADYVTTIVLEDGRIISTLRVSGLILRRPKTQTPEATESGIPGGTLGDS